MRIPNLEIERRHGCWWIVGVAVDHDEADGGVGPYDRKVDAEDDQRGLQRFCRTEMVPAESTTEPAQLEAFE